ncbi:hypothetical protein AAG570_009503 [Ranatra chinensis]|uniref:RING-type domain-containing protein n=1 Tax=Ranatra chinensis TaxID=642074 RepID=A0ABD0YPD4_9HEMI
MSIQTKVLSLVDVLLRVPPLFIIDELFRADLGVQTSVEWSQTGYPQNYTQLPQGDVLFENAEHFQFQYDAIFYKFVFIVFLKFLLSCIGVLAALFTFMLWTKHLLVVYMYLISIGLVFGSYWGNTTTMKLVVASSEASDSSVLEDLLSFDASRLSNGCAMALLQNYLVQTLAACLFNYIHLGPRYPFLEKLWFITFLAPSFLALLPLPPVVLNHAPVFSAVLPLAMVKFVLWCSIFPVIQTLYSGYSHVRNFVSDVGLLPLLETEWSRLNVPCVLRTFWLLRLVEHAVALQLPAEPSTPISLYTAKSLLTTGCETVTAVLGLTSVISYICHYIGCFFQWVLLSEDEDDKSIGTVSAVLFYILALQTGLTGLEPEKRFVRLCRNFCLLFTALLHFIHNIVNPLLMSLSASHNPSIHRHVRALLVCLFLVIYPLTLLGYLWSLYPMSTWLLAVSVFSVEVIVKVCVSLLIYVLFLVDAYRSNFWEKLDDYVYYIRAFGNTVEFCCGIVLFFNGTWILIFESGGAIRAGMMGVHVYFNIWCEARAGWSVFMKRRTAVNKIESLPEANRTQLAELDDVCAICYQEMKSAKITRCNHFFHGVCLRKWLYVQVQFIIDISVQFIMRKYHHFLYKFLFEKNAYLVYNTNYKYKITLHYNNF